MSLRFVGAILVTAVLVGRSGAAQERWTVSLEIGAAQYGGTSLDTSTTIAPGAFRPHNPTVATLRVDRRVGPVRVGLALARARADVGITGEELLVVTHELRARVVRIAPEIAIPLAKSRHEGTLVLTAGPALELWTLDPGDASRTRLGGMASLAIEQALAGSLAGVVRLTGTLTPSLFEPGELPVEFERRATWSLVLGVGLAFRR